MIPAPESYRKPRQCWLRAAGRHAGLLLDQVCHAFIVDGSRLVRAKLQCKTYAAY